MLKSSDDKWLVGFGAMGCFGLGFGADHLVGAAAGDRLAFAGAMFGAAAAVIGTAVVAARTRRQEERAARDQLAAIADSVKAHAELLCVPFEPDMQEFGPFALRSGEMRAAVNGLIAERYEFDDVDLRRKAGWFVDLQLIRRAIYDEEQLLRSLRDRQDIADGDQHALQHGLVAIKPVAARLSLLAASAAKALRR